MGTRGEAGGHARNVRLPSRLRFIEEGIPDVHAPSGSNAWNVANSQRNCRILTIYMYVTYTADQLCVL